LETNAPADLGQFRLRLVFATSEGDRRAKCRRIESDRKECASDNEIQFFRGHQTKLYTKAGKERSAIAFAFGYTKSSPLARTSSMKDKPDSANSSLSETMAARIEIKELGDPAHQKKITDAVEALDGVIETKIAKGALHVSYDPLTSTEKKIEQAIRSTGTSIKAAATDTEGAHPDLPT
jgi:copper chaperone CopZ